jgi:anaerobic magnesium-protoporphyrin IX monomethyl ester cyclase
LKVLLVVPPYLNESREFLGELKLSTIPLGQTYIAAVLESNGFSVTILDMSLLEMQIEKLEDKLVHIKPDVVGITSMTNNFQNALTVAKTAKRRSPTSIVVMGGVHPTFVHNEILETIPEVDIVVRYEGEYTMAELVKALDNGTCLEKVKGISFRKEGRVITTPSRKRIQDLDSLPYPAHHLLEPSVEEYLKHYGKRNFPVITTRGCPFGCIYCSTSAFHGRTYRTRSIPNVLGELAYLIEEYKADNISFVDDNFTMQKDRIVSLCEEMKARKLSLEWGCSARVDQVSEGLLKKMKEAGCTDIFFGIESVSQRVLNLIKKGFTIQQAKDAVKTAEKLGIRTHCSFIIGLPGESVRSLNRIPKFVEETNPSGRVLPNLLEVLPGTELFERQEEYFSKSSFSFADVTKVQLEMLLTFYKRNFKITKLFRATPPNVVFE